MQVKEINILTEKVWVEEIQAEQGWTGSIVVQR